MSEQIHANLPENNPPEDIIKSYPSPLNQILESNIPLPENIQQEISEIFLQSQKASQELSNQVQDSILTIMEEKGLLVENEAWYNDFIRLVHAIHKDAKLPSFAEVQEASKWIGNGWNISYHPNVQKMNYTVELGEYITSPFLSVDTNTGALSVWDKKQINADIDTLYTQRTAIKISPETQANTKIDTHKNTI